MKKIISPSKIQKLLKESHLYCQAGKFNEAKLIYQELLKAIPSHPDVLTNLGTIELQSGNIHAGINYLEKSIKINPIQPRAISNLGNAFLELKKNIEAINYYDLAIKMDGCFPEAYYNKARALKTSQKYPEAISNYQQAIKYNPRYFEAFLNLGFIYNELKDFTKAHEQYDFAISINPQSSEAFYNRGIVYENMGEHVKALTDYDIATKLNPNNFYAFNSKGLLFNQMKDFNNALLNFDCAIKINPNFFNGYMNKGHIYEEIKDFTKALEQYNFAINLNPGNSEIFFSKGLIFKQMKDFSSAIFNFDCAIKANPSFFLAILNKALLILQLNDYKNGWQLYESRWETTQEKCFLRTLKPKLEDLSIIKKNILIWAEQGIGDQILYGTLIKEMIKSPNMFIISVDPKIKDLFERSFKGKSNLRFLSNLESINESLYDFHLPLGSLGKFFRNSINDFQFQPFSYLLPDSNKTTHLMKKIKNVKKFTCGISWMSKSERIGSEKSLNLNQLIPILRLPNIDFIDLQYGDTKVEKKSLLNDFNIEVRSFDEIDNFNDIDGLACLISTCDFIVTISNVTAHIAGALGKKVFLILPYSGIGRLWYWHEGINNSLWYPSIQIFEQTEARDWSAPIIQIREKVIEEISYD
ncbi:GT9_LPS_heptosyltransferase domain containing protein [Candidatus Methylopumilus universalis]|uniref:tetratricopeptide repeat protein n=1 Tax=Candidatus Methylopumilus universalis TaxID=2588536 RepID=UPI003BEEF3A9